MILKADIEKSIGEPIINLPDMIYNESVITTKIITSGGRSFFLKYGPQSSRYRCEANGLSEIRKSGSIAVPDIYACSSTYLLTEFIERSSYSNNFYCDFGKSFAKMHKKQAVSYGFYEDNYIGKNIQPNIPDGDEKSDWCTFYLNKRLLFQYRLAESNGMISRELKRSFIKIEQIAHKVIGSSDQPPSLLHGDLWSGNYICGKSGKVTLIDPAVYYGNREADLAMTMVFGRFPDKFYESYNKEYPLERGWEDRSGLYRLYHILNHLNIFGRSYLYEAESIVNNYICNK